MYIQVRNSLILNHGLITPQILSSCFSKSSHVEYPNNSISLGWKRVDTSDRIWHILSYVLGS